MFLTRCPSLPKMTRVVVIIWVVYTIILSTMSLVQNAVSNLSGNQPISAQNGLPDYPERPANIAYSDPENDEPYPDSFLQSDRSALSSALTIWCKGSATLFNFKHFLSLLSLIKVIKADLIWVFYDELPKTDSYNTWLNEITNRYPFIKYKKCKHCCGPRHYNLDKIMELLTEIGGGIFISVDVIVSHITAEFFTRNGFMMCNSKNSNIQVLMMKPMLTSYMYKPARGGRTYFKNSSVINEVKQSVTNNTYSSCYILKNVTHTQNNNGQNICYDLQNMELTLFPSDIWHCYSDFCNKSRIIMYDSAKVIVPTKSTRETPNIVHYVWYGKAKMSFTFYLSILSFAFIGNIRRVYIHCDKEPTGIYWEKLNVLFKNKHILTTVYRSDPHIVFNQDIKVVQHMADITKADISFKYGGIISDHDVILVKQLDQQFFSYDFVVSKDIGRYQEFPDILNMGLTISKPGNAFAKIWIDSMRNFNDTDWLWNAGLVTYKKLELNPTYAYISTHLQVICYNYKFYPVWLPKFKYQYLNMTFKDLVDLEDWKKYTYSFHFTYPEPYISESYLRKQPGTIGQVGRYILTHAVF